jgi:hypothetical protein
MEDEAIRNKSLFQVDGRERVLFDEKLTMELPTYEGKSQHFKTEHLRTETDIQGRNHSTISEPSVSMSLSPTYVSSHNIADDSSHP